MSRPAMKYVDLMETHEPDPLFIPPAIGWMNVGERGLGILALRDIKNGEVIEYSPVVVMSMTDLYRPDGTEIPIGAYAFHWGEENEKGESVVCGIVKGGYLALANHDKDGNSTVEPIEKDGVIEWKAIRDIRKGEEITFDYGCALWFEDKGRNPA
jgi:SET domain-containing protein